MTYESSGIAETDFTGNRRREIHAAEQRNSVALSCFPGESMRALRLLTPQNRTTMRRSGMRRTIRGGEERMRKSWLLTTLAATLLLSTTQAAQAQPQTDTSAAAVRAQQASSDDVHSGADADFGSGGAWFKFTGDSTIDSIWTYANDLSCDGNSVHTRLEVGHYNGVVAIDDTEAWSEGCWGGTGHAEGGPYSHTVGGLIVWARVIVCNDDWGDDTCVRGPKRYNPH
ncbi:hypothetical protein QFZ24_009991 [Streptomyces phaeochromogenes]|jgi:hypothetical protein|uniref:hypothetical protein n=1 Tax=Streptomyces phaeochromogenes TaxID=1923 RepID=UPI00278D7F1D|nr:hypothetical protein [Streptomyces phaeochromogenes]MDQ0955982.1 hypothetical protein [Streptomyces phaeochromogenes]